MEERDLYSGHFLASGGIRALFSRHPPLLAAIVTGGAGGRRSEKTRDEFGEPFLTLFIMRQIDRLHFFIPRSQIFFSPPPFSFEASCRGDRVFRKFICWTKRIFYSSIATVCISAGVYVGTSVSSRGRVVEYFLSLFWGAESEGRALVQTLPPSSLPFFSSLFPQRQLCARPVQEGPMSCLLLTSVLFLTIPARRSQSIVKKPFGLDF